MSGWSNQSERECKTQNAFTLVELLTVIAIIGILATLLFSALEKAKIAASKVICLNNLRQMQQAWIFYYEDNEGKLVPNAYEGGYPPSTLFAPSWVNGVMSYANLPWLSDWYLRASTNIEYLVNAK